MRASSLPGSVKPEQPLAAAHEDLDPQLVLEILDVFADAGLRGVERAGYLGQVEIAPHGLANDAQLLEVHESRAPGPPSNTCSWRLTRRTDWPEARPRPQSSSRENLGLEHLLLGRAVAADLADQLDARHGPHRVDAANLRGDAEVAAGVGDDLDLVRAGVGDDVAAVEQQRAVVRQRAGADLEVGPFDAALEDVDVAEEAAARTALAGWS